LLDGNHRLAAHEQAGHEKIWIERWDIPKHYLKLIAQAANTEVGNIDTPLTGKEKKRAILQDWEDGIRDINLIAEALKTTPNYVRKVLSQAGLIRDRKKEMKKRARELRDEGLSYREIAKRLEEEFGENIPKSTVSDWLNECPKNYLGKKSDTTPTDTPTVRSTLDDSERLVEEEEELLAVDEIAGEADWELSLKEKIEEAKRLIKEEGSVPAEAYKRAGLPEDWEKKYEVLRELLEVWESTEAGRRRIKEELSGLKTEDKPKKKEVKLKSKEELYKEIVDTINLQLRRWQQIEGEEGVIRLLEELLEMYKSGRYKNNPSWRRANGVYLAEFRRI
ncbi:MAG: hypothetical protein ABGX17_00545, partial [Desulfurobacteriaceae bacterium]